MAATNNAGFTIAERHAVVQRIALLRSRLVDDQVEEFYRRHPEWRERHGERGRALAREDAGFHLDFLAGAIESGAVEPFVSYALWCVRMFGARGIGAQSVIEFLRIMEAVLAPHLGPRDQALVGRYIDAACAAAQGPQAALEQSAASGGFVQERGLFLQALLQGNRAAAWGIVREAIRAGADIRDIYMEIFQWCMVEIGRLWEANRIVVAQEHMATAITQYVMALTFQRLAPVRAGAGRVVITGVQGELHQVGANMVADVLEADGWVVRFLGVNMPHNGILRMIEDHQAQVLGISTTVLSNLPNAIHLVQAARAAFGDGLKFVLGGAAFRLSPGLIPELGAEGFANDLREARALMAHLAAR